MTCHPNRRQLLLLLALLAALSTSCSQVLGGRTELRERRKFIIEAVPLRLSLPNSERPYQYRVLLESFSVSRFYERDQIIYRLSPEEIHDDRYNTWAVRPSDMLTDAVASYVKQAQLFTDARQEFLDVAPDFTLSGSVRAIERFDSGDRWYVRLDVGLQLVDRANQIVWTKDFEPVEEEVFDADPVFAVQAMRELVRYNMERVIRDLDRTLLIRKLQTEGRDIAFLLDNENGDTVTDTVAIDGVEEMPRSTKDYVVLPGTLVTGDGEE